MATLRVPRGTMESASTQYSTVTRHVDSALDQIYAHRDMFIGMKFATVGLGNYVVGANGKQTLGSVFIIPIRVPSGPHTYQPRYADDVVKFAVAVSHHGYVFFVSDQYSGAAHDDVLPEHSGFISRLATDFPGLGVLDDDLHSENMLADGSVPARKKARAENPPLDGNARRQGLFRRRVEDVFGGGAGAMRFTHLMENRWTRDVSLVTASFIAACVYRNAEVWWRHGTKGLNQPCSPPSPLEAFYSKVGHPRTYYPLVFTASESSAIAKFSLLGVATYSQLKFVLKHFRDDEIIAELPEKSAGIRFFLIEARRRAQIESPARKGKFKEWIAGKVTLAFDDEVKEEPRTED